MSHIHLTILISACWSSTWFPLTPDLHWAPISTLVQPVLTNRFKQHLQINNFITLDMLSFIPLHFLCTHFWQVVHYIVLPQTPVPHTPHGHLAAFCISFWHSPITTTLLLFIFTHMPLLSTLSFHSLSLVIRSSPVSASITKSSAHNNSHGKTTWNSLDIIKRLYTKHQFHIMSHHITSHHIT